jgi:2,4-dienoyl-CoA reductase-like NADH-dependent reductase (Old Yellow Enzyme family)
LLLQESPRSSASYGRGQGDFFEKTITPSAIPLNLGEKFVAEIARHIIFGTPREVTLGKIETVISQFVKAARIAYKSGFNRVEIHAARKLNRAACLSTR